MEVTAPHFPEAELTAAVFQPGGANVIAVVGVAGLQRQSASQPGTLAGLPGQNAALIVAGATTTGHLFQWMGDRGNAKSMDSVTVGLAGIDGRIFRAPGSKRDTSERALLLALDGEVEPQNDPLLFSHHAAATHAPADPELWIMGLVMGTMVIDQVFAAADEDHQQATRLFKRHRPNHQCDAV